MLLFSGATVPKKDTSPTRHCTICVHIEVNDAVVRIGLVIFSLRYRSFARILPVAGVLDEPYSQLIPHSRVAVQARQSTKAVIVSILCSLAGRYGTPLSWLT